MSVKKKFSLAIVDVEKIAEVNKIVLGYSNSIQEYSTHFYFSLSPIHGKDIYKDITIFQLESESESDLNKKLNDLIEELEQLNTGYAIRDEDTNEMVVEIEHVTAIDIKFNNVKFLKEGTFDKIDELNHLKTEFGICKKYSPNFRPVENRSIENTEVGAETIYLFSDTAENLSKLKAFVSDKVKEIDPDLVVENKQFMFLDEEPSYLVD